jgi:carboxyl-terminal processing protease
MSAKSRIAVVTLSAGLAFYAIVGGFLWNRSATAKGNQWAQLRIFDEVLFHIVKDYVDEPDLERVRTGALRGLADGLDPYSAYLTPAQAAEFKSVEPGLQEIGGMALSKVGGYVYVVSVLEGSSAERSGIAAGDFIEYLGKGPTRDMSLYDAEMLLLGQQGPTELKIFRRGESLTVTFTPGAAQAPPVETKILEPGVGYVKVHSLADGRAAQTRDAIEQLAAKGAKRLVLDLRGVAVGKLEEGAALADLFVDEGVLARKVKHKNSPEVTIAATRDATVFRGPLSVVVDRSTAGAGEVVAAAILAAKRGEVVGEKTFGAGVELGVFRLRDGGALLMTVARFAPGAGKPFIEEPVTPSTTVARAETAELVAPDSGEDDAQDAEEAENEAKPAPKVAPKPAPADDVQLKKAVEVLKAAAEAPAAKAA